MRSRPLALVTIAFSTVALFPAAASAGRTLEEPKGVRDVVKTTPRAAVQKALGEAGVSERCSDAALRSGELNGVACRLVVHSSLSKAKPLASAKDVQRRVTAAKDAWLTARTIASYAPLTKLPRLDEDRFEAHRRACDGLVDAWDALRGVPKAAAPELRAAVDAALKEPGFGEQAIGEAACACTAKTLELSTAGGASLELTGALQGTLTSRGCFLDASKIRAERGGPKARFSGRAKTLSEQSTDEAQMVAYAKTRDVGLERCRDKFLAKGVLGDKSGMEKCVCGEVKRWTFPKKKGRPELVVLLPVYDERLGVQVGVSAPGKVTSCGPLQGALAQ